MFNFDSLVAYCKASRETVPDEVALKAKELYPEWKAEKTVVGDDGVEVKIPMVYAVGNRRRYGDKLYKCRQAHTSEAQFTPDLIPALWEVINETHAGTLEDPIPYDPNMVVFEGLYYTYEDVLYKCVRDSGNPLYSAPSALVGNYFEVV